MSAAPHPSSHGDGPFTPVSEHAAACLDLVRPLPPLDVALRDALGCVLAEDVVSPRPLPAFDNSGMDGYAVRVRDVEGASEESPVGLPVVADIAAGSGDPMRLPGGACARIMTGAPVPAGAEAVVPVEWTDRGVAHVTVRRAPRPGQHVRRAGEDVAAGVVVVEAGTRLQPRHVGVLAAVGRARVRVRPRPRVVVVSTGAEVVEPGAVLAPGQLHDTNGYLLTAAAEDVGALAYRVGVVDDDAAALAAVLDDQLVRADVVVTSGGVSEGAYDTVKEVLSGPLGERAGHRVRFGRVAVQPGMPQGAGTLGEQRVPVFTLPGNPVSSFVSFEVFVRPALRRMLGAEGPDPERPRVRCVVARGWTSPSAKEQYVRCAWTRGEDGRLHVAPVSGHGSHLVTALARTTCLAVVPVGTSEVEVGDEVECVLLGPLPVGQP
ncbi:molybdopterin molybdotransferase MoeA [Kineococcus sp. TRM81007]|uniref:molybdotransferase-like divisome protein Glp n=1 Tax=Kineococcus sp. TRM81007 TaxID=2925831 RepID=UPI001F59BAE4|nr:gephyrin-like molybdotransferase Glp [Kineococcus sp. TRM81007]MCI2239865.1 molybdopterin molybdotransferase MoeA [Kineococcus sp. TRM81007]